MSVLINKIPTDIPGDFLQRPGNHIRSGQGCPKCAGNINKGSQEFIEEVIKIHGDIYDYSKVDYKNANTKIIISCKIHGDFEEKPYSHLNGHGCSMCSRINSAKKRTLSKDEFIERARLVRGDKYDYSKVDYKYSKEDVIIICKIHSDFLQRPGNHIRS